MTVMLQARDTTATYGIIHQVGFDLRPSRIMPTHSFYRGENPLGKSLDYGGSVHIRYSFSLPDEHLHPLTSQGLGFSVNTFGIHDYLGTPVCIYLFQHVPVLWLNDRWSLDYEWNFGISLGWKHKTSAVDSPNALIGSYANAYIGIAGLASYRVNKKWRLSIGPEYTHFSNGDTSFPNGGANTVNLRVGLTRNFGAEDHDYRHKVELRNAGNIVYDLVLYGAWRADRTLIDNHLVVFNDKFPLGGFNFNPLYRFNDIVSAGASLDFVYDSSANLIVNNSEVPTYSFPSPWKQFACGISARGELSMPVFSVNIGLGYNVLHLGNDLKGFYGLFALKAFLSEKAFLHIGYRLSNVLYGHNLMLGFGWRFGNVN